MSGRDPDARWERFKRVTRARIDLGRAGDGLPTRRALEFDYACALARDAVWASVDCAALARDLAPAPVIAVRSEAPDRATFLRRPDLGRRLRPEDRALLPGGPYDAVFIVADGLSAGAVQRHAAPTLRALAPRLGALSVAPLIAASQARVALGDEIGAAMRARLAVMLIGERPGLSAPDSLGIYLTYAPRVGRLDAQRNCISNVHGGGLSHEAAAATLEWLMSRALALQVSGVALKEDAPRAGAAAIGDQSPEANPAWLQSSAEP